MPPSSYTQVVLLKTGAMFAVMLAGWWIARRRWLGEGAGPVLSRIVVDVAFPALVFTQMLRTVDAGAMRTGWMFPFLTSAVVLLSSLPGFLLARWLTGPGRRATFAFLVTIPNWVYLPLPIAQALFGDAGVRGVLLGNVGAQVVLWSFGVWILRHGVERRELLRGLLLNPGILATVLGIVLALSFPVTRLLWDPARVPEGFVELISAILVQGLEFLGGLTIPLSLLVIGLQLGALRLGPPSRVVWGVVAGRLLIAPALWMAVVQVAALVGVHLGSEVRMIVWLIALMPVALSCSVFAERFGGDSTLAAESIFWTTLLSLATVPLGFAAYGWAYGTP